MACCAICLLSADSPPGTYCCDIRGSQIKARVEQAGIKTYGLFKVHNGGLELRVTVGLHSLIKVVTRLQPIATAGSERQQQHPTERGEFIEFHQRSSVDGGERGNTRYLPQSPS